MAHLLSWVQHALPFEPVLQLRCRALAIWQGCAGCVEIQGCWCGLGWMAAGTLRPAKVRGSRSRLAPTCWHLLCLLLRIARGRTGVSAQSGTATRVNLRGSAGTACVARAAGPLWRDWLRGSPPGPADHTQRCDLVVLASTAAAGPTQAELRQGAAGSVCSGAPAPGARLQRTRLTSGSRPRQGLHSAGHGQPAAAHAVAGLLSRCHACTDAAWHTGSATSSPASPPGRCVMARLTRRCSPLPLPDCCAARLAAWELGKLRRPAGPLRPGLR